MKAWSIYFKEVRRFFLVEKTKPLAGAKKSNNDFWYTTRVGAVQDFLRLDTLRNTVIELQNEIKNERRMLAKAVGNKAGRKRKVVQSLLEQCKSIKVKRLFLHLAERFLTIKDH